MKKNNNNNKWILYIWYNKNDEKNNINFNVSLE